MRRFHVIAETPDIASTLVIETAAGWLLPWLDDDPKVELPKQLDALLRPLLASFDLVHEAPLPETASAHEVVQGYCVVAANGPALSAHATFVANADLDARPAILSFQRRAWSLALERLRTPVADFDSVAQITDTLAWIERQVATRTGGRVLSMTRHRCSRYEYVARLETTYGTMYFKGGSERVADEGVLTDLLHASEPGIVPETLALDVASGRWIYRELPGKLLSDSMLTMTTATTVVSVLANLQKRTIGATPVRDHLASRHLTAVGLFEAVDRIVRSVCGQEVNDQWETEDAGRLFQDWRSNRDAIFERCLAVDRLELPRSLVPSDFWPRNILTTPDGVGFIDLERSYWSYSFLPLWRYSLEVERALQAGGLARGRIESAFVNAWAEVVAPRNMTIALAELPLLGQLFGLLLASGELDLRERDLGSQLSTGYRLSLLSRHVRRLLSGLVDHA